MNNAVPIFFSHSNDDRRWCELLATDAEQIGVTAYLAEHDPHAGTPLADKVKTNITNAKAVVVFLTNNSEGSAYVHQEVGYALARGKLVIPVVQPGLPPGRLAMLQGLEYIEFDFEDPGPARESLVMQLGRIAERQQKQGEIEALMGVGLCLAIVALLLHEGASVSSPA